MIVCSFISDDRNRKFATYMLDVYQENIESFMKNGRLSLDDSNFIDESNILDFVSDEPGSYFPQLYQIETIEFKCSSEYRRQFELRNRVN